VARWCSAPDCELLRTDRRVDVVEILAGPDGALVSDLVLTARAQPVDVITLRDRPAEISGPRSAS
jgi:hypothetical protein